MVMQVEEILHHEKSQYQDIFVFKRCVCGWVWLVHQNEYVVGQAMSLHVDEILHLEKSQYQDILAFNRCERIISSYLPWHWMKLSNVQNPLPSLPPSCSLPVLEQCLLAVGVGF